MTPSPKRLFLFTLLLFALLALAAPAAFAQQAEAGKDEEPTYKDYKGVRIGMTADEARKKLGDPADKGDKQDFYIFSDGNEMAQVFYDTDKKVFAVSVIYMSGANGTPTAKA